MKGKKTVPLRKLTGGDRFKTGEGEHLKEFMKLRTPGMFHGTSAYHAVDLDDGSPAFLNDTVQVMPLG